MKSIRSDEFFKLVAINSGVSDLETVKGIFYGMVKTISRELKEKQTVKLPDWGEFTLKIYKSRKIVDVNQKSFIAIPAKTVIKFTPDYKVKKHFYRFGEDSTVI